MTSFPNKFRGHCVSCDQTVGPKEGMRVMNEGTWKTVCPMCEDLVPPDPEKSWSELMMDRISKG